jgi:hypothetical protein
MRIQCYRSGKTHRRDASLCIQKCYKILTISLIVRRNASPRLTERDPLADAP